MVRRRKRHATPALTFPGLLRFSARIPDNPH
jgi:hypothetical protein